MINCPEKIPTEMYNKLPNQIWFRKNGRIITWNFQFFLHFVKTYENRYSIPVVFFVLLYYIIKNNYYFGCFSLVHDVLSDEESTTEASTNTNFETNNNAFNVFSTSDDDQKNKYDINLSIIIYKICIFHLHEVNLFIVKLCT